MAPLILEYDSFSSSGYTEQTNWEENVENTD